MSEKLTAREQQQLYSEMGSGWAWVLVRDVLDAVDGVLERRGHSGDFGRRIAPRCARPGCGHSRTGHWAGESGTACCDSGCRCFEWVEPATTAREGLQRLVNQITAPFDDPEPEPPSVSAALLELQLRVESLERR